MAEITREKAIDTLKRLKTTHMGDFGWDSTGIKAFDFAISDMGKVEKLEEENARLKERYERRARTCNELSDGINELEAEIERMREKLAKARGGR